MENNNKLEAALKASSMILKNTDEKDGILYVSGLGGTIKSLAEDACKLKKEMPEYAAVKFLFQGEYYTVTDEMSAGDVLKVWGELCNAAQIEREIDTMLKFKDQVSKESPRFGEIIKQPEVVEASNKFSEQMISAVEKRKEKEPIFAQMEALKKQLEALKEQAEGIENEARTIERNAKDEFGGKVGGIYRDQVNAEVDEKLKAAIESRNERQEESYGSGLGE